MTKDILKELNTIAINLTKRNKAFNGDAQTFLVKFIDNYNTALSFNSTPLSKLLKGIKKTDARLIMEYFKRVTNAVLWLNAKKEYVIKYVNSDDKELKTNDNYATLKWYDLASKATVTIKDEYANITAASKALESVLTKAFNTAHNDADKKTLMDIIKNYK